MERRKLLAGVTGAVGITGLSGCLGSGDGEEDSGEQQTIAQTATATSTESEATAEPTDDAAAATEASVADIQWDAAVENIEKCGRTCRTLTYTLKNLGSDPAPSVMVGIEVFTGGNSIWNKDQDIGEVGAKTKRTGISKDIDVGLLGGQKIKSNDGKITVELTPKDEDVSKTFTFEATLDV
jgi:archaellum component FlaG (FlaF/FlaG flagellin family)